jgi:hypothetical protein
MDVSVVGPFGSEAFLLTRMAENPKILGGGGLNRGRDRDFSKGC